MPMALRHGLWLKKFYSRPFKPNFYQIILYLSFIAVYYAIKPSSYD